MDSRYNEERRSGRVVECGGLEIRWSVRPLDTNQELSQHWTASFRGVLGGFVTDLCNRMCNSQEVVQQFWTLVSQPSV